jgi:murein DD-endopeptidase MepM/ murein hydrolase activator NlpD
VVDTSGAVENDGGAPGRADAAPDPRPGPRGGPTLAGLVAVPSDAGPTDGPPPPPPPDPCAGPPVLTGDAAIAPLFRRPFVGSFRLGNHFDHDTPREFSDTNGRQVSWCGVVRQSEIDGHRGYDFLMPTGTPLYAPADGVVDWAGPDDPFYCPLLGRMVTDQLFVEITHHTATGVGVTSGFKHLSRVGVVVGQQVQAGDVVGMSGSTGCSTAPHLHFEVWRLDGTNDGHPALIDPFGWQGGPAEDPWVLDPHGAPSLWLWLPGAAPPIFPDR